MVPKSEQQRPSSGRGNKYLYGTLAVAAILLVSFVIVSMQKASPVAMSVATVPTTVSKINSLPMPDHVLIVMEENHSYNEIIGSPDAPYINLLATAGALFTSSHGVTHPSQPNYLLLFSGSAQGVTDDACPPPGSPYSTANLGQELISAGLSFDGYSEDLPSVGSTVCQSGKYYRKHNPWVNFSNVPTASNQPFTNYPSDYASLPKLSFVIPNQDHDMHDGTIAQADTWLQSNLDGYRQWAATHNSLLIVTWDEDDSGSNNQIPTIFVGPMVLQGQYAENINHLNVLRTLEDMYGLPYAGQSGSYQPIIDVWAGGSTTPTPTTGAATGTATNTSTPVATTATATNTALIPTMTVTVLALTSTRTRTATVFPTVTNTRTSTIVFTATSTGTPTTGPSATVVVPTGTSAPSGTATAILSATIARPTDTVSASTGTPTSVVTSTACAIEFSDVPPDSSFYLYVRCLSCQGILGGYSDGTFRPGNDVTRGQLSKIVANSAGFNEPHDAQTFEDVGTDSAFYVFVERMSARGIIGGYPCGSAGEPCVAPDNRPYFRPGGDATRGQISKIVALAAGYNDPPGEQLFEDVGTDSTFYLYVQQLAQRGILGGYPCGGDGEPCNPPDNRPYFRPGNHATRGQVAKIVSNAFFPNYQP